MDALITTLGVVCPTFVTLSDAEPANDSNPVVKVERPQRS
jgi:hypothetical protein